MKALEDLSTDGKPVAHITHIQFSSFKGDSWGTMCSASEEISSYMNNHNHMTIDMGQLIFTDTTTMTADGPFEYTLYELSGHKWVNSDVETETSGGIIPFHYKKKNVVNATQWSIGLEIALMINDPWKIFLTTDHPNGGPFFAYPKILAWLMSKKARMATLKNCHAKAQVSFLGRRKLYGLLMMTRAAQAKLAKDKGHERGRGRGVAIYNIALKHPIWHENTKPVRRAFATQHTIKDGKWS
jgi:formylmethanofuran dehydrogenase subunit A